MIIEDIIGLKIIKLKYNRSKNDGVNFFNSLLKLSNGKIISIPTYPSGKVFEYSKLKFFFSQNISKKEKFFKNQIIKNLHFKYDNDGNFCDWISESGIIELENKFFIMETTCLPNGLAAGLNILSKKDFQKLREEERKEGVIIKPYLTVLQK